MAVDSGIFAEDGHFPMEDDYEEAPMEWQDDSPPEEDFDEPDSQPMAEEDALQIENTKKPEERRLGAHGRRRAKDMVARKAKCKAKADKRILQSRFDKIDKQPKKLEELPPCPDGVVQVSPGHPWAKIHNTHALIMTHKYAACYRCGKKAASHCNMQDKCKGSRSKAGDNNIRLLTHGRNPVPSKPWPIDNAPSDATFPCHRLILALRENDTSTT